MKRFLFLNFKVLPLQNLRVIIAWHITRCVQVWILFDRVADIIITISLLTTHGRLQVPYSKLLIFIRISFVAKIVCEWWLDSSHGGHILESNHVARLVALIWSVLYEKVSFNKLKTLMHHFQLDAYSQTHIL